MQSVPQPILRPVTAFERVWRRLRAALMRLLGRGEFEVEAQGLKFAVGHDDIIEQRIAREGAWEAEQFEFIAGKLKGQTFDVFLDMGANCGFHAMIAATKKLASEVIAFEPDPGNRAKLMRNIEANGLGEEIWVLDYALGDKPGETTLTEGSRHNRGESYLAQDIMP